MGVHAYKPNMWVAETGGSSQIQSQPGLHSKALFQEREEERIRKKREKEEEAAPFFGVA